MGNCGLFLTDWGWGGIVTGSQGVKELLLPEYEQETARIIISSRYPNAVYDEEAVAPIREALLSYFCGERAGLSFPLDLSGQTAFKRSVYLATQRIPYGEVRTYGWISEQIGRPKASRAVGQALRYNPLPIIVPCHRVIKRDGTLGGFSSKEGVELKIRLLQLEGVNI